MMKCCFLLFIYFMPGMKLRLLPLSCIWVSKATGAAACKHGLINYVDIEAKWRHLKKFTCKGTLRQVFTVSVRGPLPSYESITPPPLYTVFVYIKNLLIQRGKGGGGSKLERR